MNLLTLGISYRWNHTVFVLLWLTYFTQHVLKIHPCHSTVSEFSSFSDYILFHCIVHPILFDKHLDCFYFWGIVNHANVNISLQYLFEFLLWFLWSIQKFYLMVIICVIFWGIAIPFFTLAALFYISSNNAQSSNFSTHSPTSLLFSFLKL